MKHGDARMLLTVQDPVARDNFQRLNRLFANGEFAMGYGNLTLNVQHMTTPDQQMLFHWQKLGRLITISIDSDTNGALKSDGTNPACEPGLPFFLRPRSAQIFAVSLENNGALTIGRFVVNTDGTLAWQAPWVSGAVARIYATSVSYLGV